MSSYTQGVPGERGPQGYEGVDGINVSTIDVSELVDKYTLQTIQQYVLSYLIFSILCLCNQDFHTLDETFDMCNHILSENIISSCEFLVPLSILRLGFRK